MQNSSAPQIPGEVAGTCFEAGWSSIASYLKSGGRIGISCKQVTQEEAINAAKSAYGSGYCARIFTYEIRQDRERAEAIDPVIVKRVT